MNNTALNLKIRRIISEEYRMEKHVKSFFPFPIDYTAMESLLSGILSAKEHELDGELSDEDIRHLALTWELVLDRSPIASNYDDLWRERDQFSGLKDYVKARLLQLVYDQYSS